MKIEDKYRWIKVVIRSVPCLLICFIISSLLQGFSFSNIIPLVSVLVALIPTFILIERNEEKKHELLIRNITDIRKIICYGVTNRYYNNERWQNDGGYLILTEDALEYYSFKKTTNNFFISLDDIHAAEANAKMNQLEIRTNISTYKFIVALPQKWSEVIQETL